MKRRLIFLLSAAVISSATHLPAITLSAAMNETLSHNPAIRQAKDALEIAAGRRLVLRSISYPDLAIKGVIGLQGGKRDESSAVKPFGFAQGNFEQPLFNAGIPAARRRGDLEILIAEQQLNLTIVDQLHRTRLSFYTALYNRALNSLQQDQLSRLQQNVTTQQARFESGTSERSDISAAKMQIFALDPAIETANRAHGAALLDLVASMGADGGPVPVFSAPEGLLRFEPTHFILKEETKNALLRRADLKLARLLVRAANEDERVVAADFYPEVKAIVGGDYIPVSGIRRGDEGSPHRSDDYVSSEIRAGAAYNWRVIDNGKVGGAVLQQREAREINNLLLEKLEAGVPRELAEIESRLRAIAARQQALEHAAVVARETLKDVQQNLNQGLASQLEYRDAENSLLETETGLLNAAYEQSVARAEWDRASGRYFQFSDDTAAKVH